MPHLQTRRMLRWAPVVAVLVAVTTAASMLAPGTRPPSPTVEAISAMATPGLGGIDPTSAPTSAPVPGPVDTRPPARPDAPNIVLISTDDQRDDELRWMPFTRRLIGGAGVDFVDGVSPHPLCCPARAEILTGENSHNNGVHDNGGRWGGYAAFVRNGHHEDNLGTWLQEAGYRTGFVGKMMNGYEDSTVPMAGWDYWSPVISGIYAYYGTRFADDGTGSPRTYRRQYVTDVVRDQTLRLVDEWADAPGDRPFFLWASHLAPHTASRGSRWSPPVPPVRHEELYGDLRAPVLDDVAFNEAGVGDKPFAVREPRLSTRSRTKFAALALARIRSLRSVDRANRALIERLEELGELDDTVVVFVSDNGFLLGEHRLQGKNYVYDENLQVPFLMRGPGVPVGVDSPARATLVDLAPTFLDFAGRLEALRSRGRTDGVSLRPVLAGRPRTGNTTLIQAGQTNRPWRFRGVRTVRYTYARWFDGVEELYDRRHDPHELHNLVRPDGSLRDLRYLPVYRELQRRRAILMTCDGSRECEQPLGPMPRVD